MNETTGDLGPPPPTPEEAAVIRIRRKNRFYKVAGIWLIGWVGLIVEKIVKLDSVVNGLRDGLTGGALVAPFILILTLPLAWLGARIGSREKWRRYRLWFTFALPTLYALIGVIGALKGRYFPQERFKRLTGVEFPRDVRVERYVHDDGFGPVYDWSHTFEFSCPVEVTDRLIREMKLREVPSFEPSPAVGPFSGGGAEFWSGNGSREGIYIQMETNASRDRLRISCFTI